MVKVNDIIPKGELYFLEKGEPEFVTTEDLFTNRNVVVFGLPGAFTTVCSNKQVPEYEKYIQDFKELGVDFVVCVSVNDPYVMESWRKDLSIPKTDIIFLSDPNHSYTESLGLLQYLPELGNRSIRYSMLVMNRKVAILNVEEKGGKSYKISGPENMLAEIQLDFQYNGNY